MAFAPVGTVLGPLAGAPALALAAGGHMSTGDWAIGGWAGPELVYADTPGNVLSAHRTRGVFGAGPSGGNMAYIDARGADIGAVARLEAALHAMNYSFEQRAIGAIANERSVWRVPLPRPLTGDPCRYSLSTLRPAQLRRPCGSMGKAWVSASRSPFTGQRQVHVLPL